MNSLSSFRRPTSITRAVAAVALLVAASLAMAANVSLTAILFALGIAPGVVIALRGRRAPSPSVAQILYSVDTKDGRS